MEWIDSMCSFVLKQSFNAIFCDWVYSPHVHCFFFCIPWMIRDKHKSVDLLLLLSQSASINNIVKIIHSMRWSTHFVALYNCLCSKVNVPHDKLFNCFCQWVFKETFIFHFNLRTCYSIYIDRQKLCSAVIWAWWMESSFKLV